MKIKGDFRNSITYVVENRIITMKNCSCIKDQIRTSLHFSETCKLLLLKSGSTLIWPFSQKKFGDLVIWTKKSNWNSNSLMVLLHMHIEPFDRFISPMFLSSFLEGVCNYIKRIRIHFHCLVLDSAQINCTLQILFVTSEKRVFKIFV